MEVLIWVCFSTEAGSKSPFIAPQQLHSSISFSHPRIPCNIIEDAGTQLQTVCSNAHSNSCTFQHHMQALLTHTAWLTPGSIGAPSLPKLIWFFWLCLVGSQILSPTLFFCIVAAKNTSKFKHKTFCPDFSPASVVFKEMKIPTLPLQNSEQNRSSSQSLGRLYVFPWQQASEKEGEIGRLRKPRDRVDTVSMTTLFHA